MYESPIEIIYGQMNTQIENDVLTTVQKYGIHVDKEELIKALKYDRGQYEKGYKDAKAEIIRCEDCVRRDEDAWEYGEYDEGKVYWCDVIDGCVKADDYCSYAEKRGV